MSLTQFLPLVLSFLPATGFHHAPIRTGTASVYICKDAKSAVYHMNETCRGLVNCSTKIYKVTLEEAKKLGRRPCKIEYSN